MCRAELSVKLTGRPQTELKAALGGIRWLPAKREANILMYLALAPSAFLSRLHCTHAARMFATAVFPERLSCSVSKETF
jgi:hypothetical protein